MNVKPLAVAALLALSTSVWAAPIQSVDRVLAVVDQQVVTVSELAAQSKKIRASLPKGSNATEQQIQSQALSDLVDQSLMVQLAQRTGIQVSDAEIKQNLNAVPRQDGQTEAQWHQSIRNVLLIEKVKQRDLYSRVRVSDAEIMQAIDQLPASAKQGHSGNMITAYMPQHILVAVNAQTSDAQALEKIRQLRAQLNQGESFEAVARAHSQDPGSAANGGVLGWAIDGMFMPEFEKTMKSLPQGALSEPVRTTYGYHLIKVLQTRQQDAGDAQLRAQVRQNITEAKSQELYGDWINQLRQQAYVSVR